MTNKGRPKSPDSKADWKDPVDAAEQRKEVRRLRRRIKLDEIVPDRRCKDCGKIELRTASWVVGVDSAVCRKCYDERWILERGKLVRMSDRSCRVDCAAEQIVTYRLDPEAVQKARKLARLSATRLAADAMLSRRQVQQIETGALEMTADEMRRIGEVFAARGVLLEIAVVNPPDL